jgi:ribonuclease P protein component
MVRPGRLTSAADYRRTYSEGRRASTKAVVAHVLMSDEARPARVGISTSRALRKAVDRNRAKRRLREAVRRIRPEIRPGADVVVVATASTVKVDFQDMVDSVSLAVARAGGAR